MTAVNVYVDLITLLFYNSPSFSVDDVVEVIGISKSMAWVALREAVNINVVERVGRGRYRVLARTERAFGWLKYLGLVE